MDRNKTQRQWLKANFNSLKDIETDKQKKIKQPLIQKEVPEGHEMITLPKVDNSVITKGNIFDCLMDRKSSRVYEKEGLTVKELSFLLWVTQGVKKVVGKVNFASFRPVPSGGACHPFETYLVINKVEGLKQGIYRYIPIEHKLVYLFNEESLEAKVTEAVSGQSYVSTAPVIFMWSCIPYRTEWKYDIAAHKTILQDSGHMCQNLYLASEAIGCGTVAVGDYNQEKANELLKLDGEDEFVIYIAPVGKVAEK